MAQVSRQTTRPTLGPRCARQRHAKTLRDERTSVSSPTHLGCTPSANGSLQQIHQNVLTGIQALCTAVMDLGLTGETDDDALELMDEILNISEGQVDLSEDKDIGNKLSSLWRDPAIQAAWDRRSEFHIIESHAAYFEKVRARRKVASPPVMLTPNDINRTFSDGRDMRPELRAEQG